MPAEFEGRAAARAESETDGKCAGGKRGGSRPPELVTAAVRAGTSQCGLRGRPGGRGCGLAGGCGGLPKRAGFPVLGDGSPIGRGVCRLHSLWLENQEKEGLQCYTVSHWIQTGKQYFMKSVFSVLKRLT